MLSTGKNINNGKIRVQKLLVQSTSNSYMDSDSGGFNYVWTNFSIYVNSSNILCISFTGSPTSGWTRNDIIHYIEFQ